MIITNKKLLDNILGAFYLLNSKTQNITGIRTSSFSVQTTQNAVISIDVTFASAFSNPPKVVIVPVSASPHLIDVAATSITANGFKANIYTTYNFTVKVSFNWIAIA